MHCKSSNLYSKGITFITIDYSFKFWLYYNFNGPNFLTMMDAIIISKWANELYLLRNY
jgi:hypothetical protein